MKIERKQIQSAVFTIITLCGAVTINLILEKIFQADSLIPAVFTLAVF